MSENVSALADDFVATIVSVLFPLLTVAFIVIFVGLILGWMRDIGGSSSSDEEEDEEEDEDEEDDKSTALEKYCKNSVSQTTEADYDDLPVAKRSGGRNGLILAVLAIAAIVAAVFIFK